MKTANARRPNSVSLIAPAIRRLEEGGAVTLARAPEGYDAFVVAELTRALAKDGEQRAVDPRFRRAGQLARSSLHRRAELRSARDRSAVPSILGLPTLRSRLAQRRRISRSDDRAGAASQEPRRPGAAAHSRRLGQRADPAHTATCLSQVRCIRRCAGQQRADGRPHTLAGVERLRAREHSARRWRLRLARRHSRPLSAWRRGADPARFLRRYARIDPRLRSGDAALDHAIALARSRADERSASDNRIRSNVSVRATRRSSARPLRTTISTPPSAKAAARLASNIGYRCSTTSSTRSLTMSGVRRSCSTVAPTTRPTSVLRSSPTIMQHAARLTRKIPVRRTISRCRQRGFI